MLICSIEEPTIMTKPNNTIVQVAYTLICACKSRVLTFEPDYCQHRALSTNETYFVAPFTRFLLTPAVGERCNPPPL